MMKIGIFYNESNLKSQVLVNEFYDLIQSNGFESVVLKEDFATVADCKNLDLIVVFGGDGSVLSAVKLVLDKVPLVAINTGSVGFLADYEMNEMHLLIEAIKNDGLEFSKRRLLEVKHNEKSYYAFNDAVILKDFQKDNYSSCIKLNLYLDQKRVDKYWADGLILSTATGSTAYALSAGAPIVFPELEAVVVAPICAHSLQSRPIVFSPKSTALVVVDKLSRQCALYIDGSPVASLDCGDSLEIMLGIKTVKICDSRKNFFEKLAKKIAGWKVD